MKNTATLATLAAGLSQVTATGFRGFHSAPKFDCPANTDNKCTEKQVPGFNWGDLPTGNFNNYGGFNWNGFKCENSFSKRDLLAPRTFQDKCITGVAHHDKAQAPSFGCDGKTIDKTSISGFQVTPEFDCDLEFHYDMPDGSVCKHRQACKKSGTTVENSQCGGAKNVTIVVPKQPAVPKETCHFGFHSITFDCDKPSATVPPKPRPTSSKYEATPPAATTSSTAAVLSSSSASVTVPGGPSSATKPIASVPASSTKATESSPVATPSSSKVTESSPVATESSTKATESSPVATESSTKASESVPVPTQPVTQVTASTYMTTSTVFSTSTIVSCSSDVAECPGSSVTTIVTVPISTTISPVTETQSVEVTPTKPAEVPSPSGDKPSGGKPSTVETGSATAPASSDVPSSVPSPSGDKPSTVQTGSATVPASSATTPAGPVETLPCPGVVPSCLNTWMFSVGCKDNSDSECYCPDAKFTKNIVQCLAAHGETEEVISEAIEYFKGICAPFVPQNPAIVTETITYITATPTPVPSAVYTTITAVVPGTAEGGNSPSQSTVLTVPQVGFTTVTSDESSTDVGVVPGTYPAVPAPTPSATGAVPTQPADGAAPYPTLITTAKPTGTGAVPVPGSPAASQTAVVTAGAARVGSGLVAAAMVAFFAL